MSSTALAVAVITRNRRDELVRTLHRLTRLAGAPPVVVVDNASADGTSTAVKVLFPDVVLLRSRHNLGAAARNLAVAEAGTELVAFADDDSWWHEGALDRAIELFECHPRLGVVCARILVGPEDRLDPTCEVMARSPLVGPPAFPGTSVLGFVACGAIVRSRAFLEVGGFEPRYGIGGEEQLLAIDLASAGWWLGYCAEVVAHHHPSPGPRGAGRERALLRNALWTTWLRRPLRPAISHTGRRVLGAVSRPRVWGGMAEAVIGLPWVLARRRVAPDHVQRALDAIGG